MKSKHPIIIIIIICVINFGISSLSKSNDFIAYAQHQKNKEEHHDHDGENHANKQANINAQGKESDHGDEDEHGEEVVTLSQEELKRFNIQLSVTKFGNLKQSIELPGEIVLNEDRKAHVMPRVSGIVQKVMLSVGDHVKTGDLMAIIDSRELAQYKATYLAAVKRELLATTNYNREKKLYEKKISSERDFLDTRQAMAEANITKKSKEQQLYALGFTEKELLQLPKDPDTTYTRFEIRAPISGTIIEKHMTLGENINENTNVFTIADLTTVWVDINIYQKDLSNIHKGQSAVIEIGHGIASINGKIAWISPRVNEETRTAMARIELANPRGDLRPGLFITARVAMENTSSLTSQKIVIPKSALQTFEDKTVIFVRTDKGFEPVPIELGKQNANSIEIISGIKPGQTYVSHGAFTLKAQLSKGAFGDGHNH